MRKKRSAKPGRFKRTMIDSEHQICSSSLTGFGGSAVNKTSQAGSFLTGGLRPDAKAELDEKEEISQTGSIQEDDDRHGAPELLEAPSRVLVAVRSTRRRRQAHSSRVG